MSKVRIVVAALSFSAAGFVGLTVHENYVDRAMVPTQGDRPTLGFGSTYHEDGRPVKLGETTTPVRARSEIVVVVRMPDGSERAFTLEASGLGGGRLRGRDRAADIERTLPVSSIVTVRPA